MKSFFKKVALLLVLAMVVTMLPAKAVSAADTDGPQLSKQVKLYSNGYCCIHQRGWRDRYKDLPGSSKEECCGCGHFRKQR